MEKQNRCIDNVHIWIKNHPIIYALITLIIGVVLGWGLSWVLPSPPVVARNIPQKELTCILNYSQELIQKRTSDNGLQITYEGKAADDPHLFNISIRNTGSLSISNDDFKKEFVVDFNDCGGILNARVNKASNRSVTEEIISNSRIDGEQLVITDFFLNPKESFTISVITNKAPSVIKYDARISDISTLKLRNTPIERRTSFRTIVLIIVSVVVVGVVSFAVIETISYKRFIEKLFSEYKTDDVPISYKSED